MLECLESEGNVAEMRHAAADQSIEPAWLSFQAH